MLPALNPYVIHPLTDWSCVNHGFLVETLQAEPMEALQPTLETLLADKDKNKQRGAAELLAGLICGMLSVLSNILDLDMPRGSKHWPSNDQTKLWEWFKPHLRRVFSQSNNDMVTIWTSFFEVCSVQFLHASSADHPPVRVLQQRS